MRDIQIPYRDIDSKVTVNNKYSDEFRVQDLILTSFLFIIVFQALTGEFIADYPWKLFYADDFILIAETVIELEI